MTIERRHAVMAVILMVVLIVVGAAVWAADRSSDKDGAAAPQATTTPGATTPGPPVIVPGRPGEDASVRPAEEIRQPGLPAYNAMDVEYVRMMIPHHTQALRMAALAPERAGDAKVRGMAERIHASQAPELGVLRAWLTDGAWRRRPAITTTAPWPGCSPTRRCSGSPTPAGRNSTGSSSR